MIPMILALGAVSAAALWLAVEALHRLPRPKIFGFMVADDDD